MLISKQKITTVLLAGGVVVIGLAIGSIVFNKIKADTYGYGCTSGYGSWGYSMKLPDSCTSYKYSTIAAQGVGWQNLRAQLYDYYGNQVFNYPYKVSFNVSESASSGYGTTIIRHFETTANQSGFATISVPVTPGKKYSFEAFTQDNSKHYVQIMKNSDSTYNRYLEFTANQAPTITITSPTKDQVFGTQDLIPVIARTDEYDAGDRVVNTSVKMYKNNIYIASQPTTQSNATTKGVQTTTSSTINVEYPSQDVGDYQIEVTATDTSGIIGSSRQNFKVIKRTSAPVVTDPTYNKPPVNASSYTIRGTATANSLVTVYTDANNDGIKDGPVARKQQLSNGQTNWFAKVILTPNTVNYFLVTAKTADSAESLPIRVAIIEKSAPDAPVITVPSAPVSVNASSYIIRGNAVANSIVTIYTDPNNDGKQADGKALVQKQLTGGATDFWFKVFPTPHVPNYYVVTAKTSGGGESAPADVPTITEISR